MTQRLISITIMFAWCALAFPTLAQDGPAAPPVAGEVDTSGEPLIATIVEVGGIVRVRDAEDQPWKPVEVGMRLTQGAEFRTGLKSYVKFVIQPDQVVALDRLGTIKILQAIRDAQQNVTTNLGMKYGRTRTDVKAAGIEHVATITSPSATLAIRGTDAQIQDGDGFPPSVSSVQGRILATVRGFRAIAMGGNVKSTINAQRPQPSLKARGDTHLDPTTGFSARSDAEFALVEDFPGLGGFEPALLAVLAEAVCSLKGAKVGVVVPNVPGPLDFNLAWFSTDFFSPSNLDLEVKDPKGNKATATNTPVGVPPAEGIHFGDDTGDFGGGAELVSWPLFFPAGKYEINVVNNGPAEAQVFVIGTKGALGEVIADFGSDEFNPLILPSGGMFRPDPVDVESGAVSASADSICSSP